MTKSTLTTPSMAGLVSSERMLVPSSEMIAVNSLRRPARSSQTIVSLTG